MYSQSYSAGICQRLWHSPCAGQFESQRSMEQERLNNVFGARLHITTLRAPAGPGIEFLEYLAPRGGRSAPADARANDLMHWQTTLVVHDVGSMAQQVRAGAFPWVSSGIISIPENRLGFVKGILVRDPDGRVMQLVEK